LGRWVNNQRQAKTKGMLKTERENRLVDSGLKWSVISTNGWTDMVNELRAYVCEKNKDGKEWYVFILVSCFVEFILSIPSLI